MRMETENGSVGFGVGGQPVEAESLSGFSNTFVQCLKLVTFERDSIVTVPILYQKATFLNSSHTKGLL